MEAKISNIGLGAIEQTAALPDLEDPGEDREAQGGH